MLPTLLYRRSLYQKAGFFRWHCQNQTASPVPAFPDRAAHWQALSPDRDTHADADCPAAVPLHAVPEMCHKATTPAVPAECYSDSS